MRFLVLPIAAFALVAAAPPPFEPTKFDRAIERSDYAEAGQIVDSLVAERMPPDGQPRQDSLLNALLGRLFLAAHQTAGAAAYLRHVNAAEIPATLRSSALLARGKAIEMEGHRTEALDAYRLAAAAADDPAAKREAVMGEARQLLVDNPEAARALVAPYSAATTPRERWEALAIMAIAASLSGNPSTADQLSQRAWADSVSAAPAALGPARVSVIRAGLAAQRGDRQAQLAMLIAANAMSTSANSTISSQLPVCGDDGIKPDDYVVFGIIVGPYNTNSLIPIAASRPAAVAPFYDRLAGRDLVKRATDSSANGTTVTLSCRSSVSSDFGALGPEPDPLLDWFVNKGIYPASAAFQIDDKAINKISTRVDEIAARYGAASPLLLEAKWQLLTALQMRAATGGDVALGTLVDLRSALAAGFRRTGAPDWFGQMLETDNELQGLGSSGDFSQSKFEAIMRKKLLAAPFSQSRTVVRTMLDQTREIPQGIARIVTEIAGKTPEDLPLRERQAWLLTVARAQKGLGRQQDALSTIRSTRLDSNSCAAVSKSPELLEMGFTSDDYPTELIPADQEGYSLFEFEVDRNGRAQSPRALVSMPSGLFDQATRKGLEALRYTAASQGKNDVSCRGEVQSVVWRLQSGEQVGSPPILPQASGDHT